MPASGRKVYATHTIRFAKIAHAPLRYVYDWCTDFRADDGKFARTRTRYTVLRPAKNRVVRIRKAEPKSEPPVFAVELVRLLPPRAWHVDQIDETDLASVDYRLSRLGPRLTKVELTVTERWMTKGFPSRSAYLHSVSVYWDRLVAGLEDRYRSGRPAKG